MAIVVEKKGLRIRRSTVWVGIALLLASCGGDSGERGGASEKETAAVVEGDLPTAVALNGLWLQVQDPDSLGLLLWFHPSGLFALDAMGDLPTTPAARGTFEVDDSTITFTSGASGLCAAGNSWSWRVGLPEDGVLHVQTEKASDVCQIPLSGEGKLVRLSPSRIGAAFPDLTAGGDGEGRPPVVSDLTGIWFPAESPGLMIWFGRDSTFAIDNDGQLAPTTASDVEGTYSVDGGTITFTNGSGEACSYKDRFSWRARQPEDGLLHIVHTEEGERNCRIPRGTKWTLVRVSPSSAASAEIRP